MILKIKECVEIMKGLDQLESFVLKEAEKERKNKEEELKVESRLFYAVGKIRNAISKRIFSNEIGYAPVFRKALKSQQEYLELKNKYKKTVKEKGKEKVEFDKEGFKIESDKFEKEHEKELKTYLEFQEKDVEFNGTLYKISFEYLPSKLPISINDILVSYDLLQE